jgi:protein disulfide-isomerase A1
MAKIFILLLVCLALAFAVDVEKDEGVLVLTEANFDEVIKTHDKILVEFYAPWCGHCKKLAPEYAKAAQKLAEIGSTVVLGKVDATEQKELGTRFEVKGFPTLKWFVNGEAQEYKGGRTEDDIVNWIKKRSGPPVTEVTDEKLEELKKTEKFVIAFYGASDSAEFKEFEVYAAGDDKHTFVHNPSSSALPTGLTAPGVAIFRQFDEPVIVHKGKIEKSELKSFISGASVPTLIEFSDEYIEPIFQEQKPAVFLFHNSDVDDHKKIFATFSQAAETLKGTILFVHSGVTKGIQQRLAEFVGVTAADMPRLMIIGFNPEGVDKFVYDGEINALTQEDVEKFTTQFQNGALKKFLKSEEIPTSQEGSVRVVVGKNFHDIVGHDDDVLLEFYAPWCGHCKSLEPKYNELATELKDVKGLIIAKCDSTANEIDGINISGFPTIKFFPKGQKEALEYEGEREIEGFKTYLEENSESYKAHLAQPEADL